MYSNMIMPDGKENYNVSDNYNESADTLEFMVQVRTTGWVGFCHEKCHTFNHSDKQKAKKVTHLMTTYRYTLIFSLPSRETWF